MDAGNEVGSRHGYQEPKFDTVFLRRQPRSLPIPGQVSHAIPLPELLPLVS
jgi:hypothetical protein